MNSMQHNLTLRRASERDSEALLLWRNDSTTRAFSISGDDVTSEQHRAWFNKALQDRRCLLVIGEIDGKPIGMVRINILHNSNLGQVSINLNPDSRGRGISRQLLRESLEFAAQTLDDISQYFAEIHPDNTASKKIFESVGFVKVLQSEKANFETYLLDSGSLIIPQ